MWRLDTLFCLKRLTAAVAITAMALLCPTATAQVKDTLSTSLPSRERTVATSVAEGDTAALTDVANVLDDEELAAMKVMAEENMGFHQQLKAKFLEGSAGFMSLVALALVIGLALCIERIIYLTLAEVNAHRLLCDIEKKVEAGDVEGAKSICRDTRGPVASVCYQGLMHAGEPIDAVERSVANYGGVEAAKLEKGCTWISLFITIAPSLGFLGTVIGMVMSFDQIQEADDISASIVAAGMKVALITTIFGIIVALILQMFYSYILSRIDRLTAQMEEAAITLLDIIARSRRTVASKQIPQ